MHDHSDIPIPFLAHFHTHHTETCMYSSASGGRCFVSLYISWVGLYSSPARPDGSPADLDGWYLIPLPYLLCHFILSVLLICHSHRPFITWPGLCTSYIHMSAYAHTSDSLTPACSSSCAASTTLTQGTDRCAVVICLIFLRSPPEISS